MSLQATSASQAIKWALHTQSTAIQDVRVHHRCTNVRMAEKLLHGTDVVARLKQMRRKRMAERVATDAFGQPGAAGRLGHRPLNNRLAQMIPRRRSKLRIAADPT